MLFNVARRICAPHVVSEGFALIKNGDDSLVSDRLRSEDRQRTSEASDVQAQSDCEEDRRGAMEAF